MKEEDKGEEQEKGEEQDKEKNNEKKKQTDLEKRRKMKSTIWTIYIQTMIDANSTRLQKYWEIRGVAINI